ncbi:Hypothetical protein D9617_10g072230 [Elsinoe fawcettii]|nr:Hypothetical protein D9617_10g072230 [Elsinoe fawcettii]
MLIRNPYPPPASDDGASEHSSDYARSEDYWFGWTHQEIIDAVRDHYEHLIRLYIPASALKLPPVGGWPNITAEAVAAYGKSDFIVELMRHLPYIENDEDHMAHFRNIEYKCYVQDYSAWTPEDFAREELAHIVACLDDDETATEHWFVLAWGFESGGQYILINTERNELVEEIFKYNRSYQGDFHKYWEQVKARYDRLETIPVPGFEPGQWLHRPDAEEEPPLDQAEEFPSQLDYDWIRKIYMDHGWPGASYDKTAALSAINNFAKRRGADDDEA